MTRAGLMLLLLAGCGGGDDDPGGPSPTALAVDAVVPAAAATNVDISAPVRITFNRALDAATVTAQGIALAAGSGGPLPAVLNYDAANRIVSIGAPLLPATAYQGTVGTSVRGSAGEQLAQAFQWSFTTREWEAAELEAANGGRPLALTVDGAGGFHLLYYILNADQGDSLRYATCSGACAVPGDWDHTAVAGSFTGESPSIAVEASGRRHIVFQLGNSARLRYGTCATACDTPAGWQTVDLSFLPGGEGYDQTSLALDQTGRLHLLTVAYEDPEYRILYATCAASCLTSASWTHTLLDEAGHEPTLAAESGGILHAAWYRQSENQIVYARCGSNCLTSASWQAVAVAPGGTFTETPLLRDADGRFHLLFNAGPMITYATCADSCLTSGNWQIGPIEPTSGSDGRLSLGLSPGRLYAVYTDLNENEVRFAACATACATTANWKSTAIAEGADPRYARIVVDPAGRVAITFNDFTGQAVSLIR